MTPTIYTEDALTEQLTIAVSVETGA